MIKRFALTLFGLLVLIGVLGGTKALQIRDLIAAGEAMTEPPTTTASALVERSEWENTLHAIGTLEAAQGVLITAEVPGRVTRLYFSGGESVQAGEKLVEQDVSTETTQLAAAESDFELARSNLDRVSRLFEREVVSRSEFDSARSQFNAAQAQVENIRSTLAKKTIVAPFDGRLGLRLVDIGQDLAAGVSIVSLQAVDPMLVNFSLPQQALAEIRQDLPVRVTTDAVPGQVFEGTISAIDTQINDATRTVRVQATLAPASDSSFPLLPGMYASVEVVLPSSEPVLMVPQGAVRFATFGDSVFVLEEGEDDSLVARQQFVQLGDARGDFVAVTKGLEPGQTVATDGVFKLRNGAPVVINDEGKPETSLEPTPDNS